MGRPNELLSLIIERVLSLNLESRIILEVARISVQYIHSTGLLSKINTLITTFMELTRKTNVPVII